VRRVDPPLACLALTLLLAAAGCARGPLHGGGHGSAPADGDSATVPDGESGDALPPDPVPADRCDPLALLADVPREVPGWTLDPEPILPVEYYASSPLGFVGRMFRSERRCAIVAAARPADIDAVFEAMEEERAASGTAHGRKTVTRRAPEANQVTALVRDGTDRIFLVRVFGSTEPETLAPFLDALLPEPVDEADAAADADAGADDGADAPPPCPARNPLDDPYDPRGFYGPPGDCWL
jgi:hypothetical protein